MYLHKIQLTYGPNKIRLKNKQINKDKVFTFNIDL